LRVRELEGFSELGPGGRLVIVVIVCGMAIGVSVSDEELKFSPSVIEFAVLIRLVFALGYGSRWSAMLLIVLVLMAFAVVLHL